MKKSLQSWGFVLFLSLCFFVINGTNISYNHFYFEIIEDTSSFLVHNILALGIQPIFGFIADIKGKEKYLIMCSLFVSCIISFFYLPLMLASIIFGISSGIIQVSGASLLFKKRGISIIPISIYIAFGILANGIGNLFSFSKFIFSGLGIILAVLLLIFHKMHIPNCVNQSNCIYTKNSKYYFLAYIIIFIIILKGFTNSTTAPSFAKTLIYSMFIYVLIALGRVTGAIIFQKLNAKWLILLSLIPSVFILAFFRDNAFPYYIGLFLLNISAILSLYWLLCILNYKGFAFGLHSLALLVGTYAGSMFSFSPTQNIILIFILFLLLCGLLLFTENRMIIRVEKKQIKE